MNLKEVGHQDVVWIHRDEEWLAPGCRGHGDEISGSVKGRQFID